MMEEDKANMTGLEVAVMGDPAAQEDTGNAATAAAVAVVGIPTPKDGIRALHQGLGLIMEVCVAAVSGASSIL